MTKSLKDFGFSKDVERDIKVPSDLWNAIVSIPRVVELWREITSVARRDWVSWVESAKKSETRARRIGQVCSKIISGKRRPCCYAVVPMNLYTSLSKNSKAKAFWKILSPDERRDFVSWINESKTPEVRQIRISDVCDKLEGGKRSI